VQYDARVVLHNRRLINFLGALACAGLLGYAYYAQFRLGLEPCPLCIFQRVTIAALGMAFLLAAIVNPRRWGGYILGALIAIAALATIGVSVRHLYIQSLPPGSVPACGAPLEAMMDMFPVTEVVRKVLTAGGECGVVDWQLLGLSMPAWVLISALVLGLAGTYANFRGR
jgi:protein dithiol:quinone oxidoreductase